MNHRFEKITRFHCVYENFRERDFQLEERVAYTVCLASIAIAL